MDIGGVSVRRAEDLLSQVSPLAVFVATKPDVFKETSTLKYICLSQKPVWKCPNYDVFLTLTQCLLFLNLTRAELRHERRKTERKETYSLILSEV